MHAKITKFSYEKGEGLVARLLLSQKLSPIHEMYSITLSADGKSEEKLLEVPTTIEPINFNSSVLKTEYLADKKTILKIKITDVVLSWMSMYFEFISGESDFDIVLSPLK